MRKFHMLFSDQIDGERRRLDFTAEDPGRAILIAEQETSDHPIEVWEGAIRLGTLTRSGGNLWRLS